MHPSQVLRSSTARNSTFGGTGSEVGSFKGEQA